MLNATRRTVLDRMPYSIEVERNVVCNAVYDVGCNTTCNVEHNAVCNATYDVEYDAANNDRYNAACNAVYDVEWNTTCNVGYNTIYYIQSWMQRCAQCWIQFCI